MPTLSDIGRRFDPLREFIQQASQELDNFGQRLDSTRQQVTRNTQQINAVIETLQQGMSQLSQEVGRCADNMSRYTSASAQGRRATEQEAQKVEDLYTIYKRLGIELTELESAKEALSKSTRELTKVEQLNNEYLRAQEGSYDRLSAKYRIIKILYDNMSKAQLKSNPEIATTLREIYEQMNLLQQATGKYQLQVGNYSKSMTGLQIATNQVVRELPVLANGVSMFAIAISNNIPIWADAIAQVNKEYKTNLALIESYNKAEAEAIRLGDLKAASDARAAADAVKLTKPLDAVVAALKGWQTWLVIILSVLPAVIRNIEKKKKATEEANKATREAIEYEKILKDAYIARDKEEVRSVATLETLYSITQDLNRSNEDRLKAAKALKIEFKDEFGLFSEEQIVMGDAIDTYHNLADALYEVAKARAYQNKITEQWEKYIDQEAIRDQAKASKNAADAEVARWQAALDNQIALGNTGEGLSYFSAELAKATKRQEEATSAFMQADMPLQEIDNAILKLRSDIPVDGILGLLLNGGGGGGGKNGGSNTPDYYWQVLEMSANMLEEGLDKELALREVAWLKEQKGYNDALAKLLELRKEANKEEQQEINTQIDYVLQLMRLGEEKYEAEQKQMIRDRINSYAQEVENEGDLEEKRRASILTTLKVEKELRNAAYNEEYEQSKKTAQDKLALDDLLRESEEKYWMEYLAMLRSEGLLTVEIYNDIMSKLAKATSKETGLSRGGRKGRKYGGIVEAVLAQTSTYGETNEFGIRVVKEEYQDFANAVDNALKQSMKLMDEWMAKRLEMAQIAVESAEREVDAARNSLNYELEARNQGYANNVDTARKELELARQKHKKALDEQKKVEQAQLAIDTATQISSLITATANIWASMTHGTGLLGPIIAAAATATMWGAFSAAKIKAAQVAQLKSEQYGEGTVEMLEGGSHASGHDIDLGTKKDGTRRRAEGGEYFAIINKRNSRKYGSLIPDVINAFNDGTFGEKYQRANAAMGNFALGLLTGNSPTDVSNLEREVRMIREQGEENRYTDSRGNMVIRYKNLTRKVKI